MDHANFHSGYESAHFDEHYFGCNLRGLRSFDEFIATVSQILSHLLHSTVLLLCHGNDLSSILRFLILRRCKKPALPLTQWQRKLSNLVPDDKKEIFCVIGYYLRDCDRRSHLHSDGIRE